MRARLAAALLLLLGARAALAEPGPAKFDPEELKPYFEAGPAQAAMARFTVGDYKGAAALFGAYADRHKKAADLGPAQFLQAVALMRAEQWDRAAKLFRSLEKSYPVLASYHALYAARCALAGKRLEQAVADVVRVPGGGVLEGEALMVRADAFAALGRYPLAHQAYEAYLKQFPGGVRAPIARYRLAQTLEKLGRPAAEVLPFYRRIFVDAAPEPLAEEAAARVAALAGTLPPDERARAGTFSAEEVARRGERFLEHNRNAEAEKIFEQALTAPRLTVALECEVRFGRAQAVFKQRPRSRSAPLYEAALKPCADAKDRERHAKALYQGGRASVSAGDQRRALALFEQLETEHAGHSYADDARLRRAEVLAEKGAEAEALKLLEALPEAYPRSDMVGEALWRLALRAWTKGDLNGVLRWTTENLSRLKREDIWYAEGRALYWNGRARERQGDAAGALKMYEAAIRQYPLSYYALLAFTRLEQRAAPQAAALKAELAAPATGVVKWRFSPRPLYREAGFLRAVELMRLRLGPEAQREITHLGLKAPSRKGAPAASGDAEELAWLGAVLLDRSGQWVLSHAVAKRHRASFHLEYPRGPSRLRWELAYPRAFPTMVGPSAVKAGIPAALLWAIAREESAFNPTVESHAHALGLTQLLVKTAKRFAPPGAKVTRETLTEPALNAQIGALYLAFLWKLWAGNPGLVIASYNAGEGAVGRWMKERGHLPFDEFIEAIPFDETRGYTKRVLSSYFVYSWLDGAKLPEVPLK